jgi:hypothetical protein
MLSVDPVRDGRPIHDRPCLRESDAATDDHTNETGRVR